MTLVTRQQLYSIQLKQQNQQQQQQRINRNNHPYCQPHKANNFAIAVAIE